ncbi:MAG: AMP-binding protein [Bryobacterales bacterium]|nr:AMP-binding protein [Bryobacterales bacterium]
MLRVLVRLIFKVFYRVEVRGEMPADQRALIISNHQSFLDAMILASCLPYKPAFMVHSQVIKSRFFAFWVKQTPHLIVDSGSPYAVKAAVQFIESGHPLVIFPEGRLTITGALMKVYDGTAFIAAKSQALVIPIHIEGADQARGFTRLPEPAFPRRWFPKIILTITKPVHIPMPNAPTGKARRRLVGEEMRLVLQRMMVECRKRRTLYDAFLDAVEKFGRDRLVVEEPTGQTFTYALLIKASMALGRLAARHSKEGEAVGVLMPNVGATLGLLLGMFAFRRVPAILNYTAGAEGMASALRASKATSVITSRAFLERARLEHVTARMEGVRFLYLEDLRRTLTLGDKLWLIGYAIRKPRSVRVEAKPTDPAVVLFTSGSEGKPKGVVLSHDNLLANLAQIRAALDFTPADKILGAMPIFHAFGLLGTFILPVMSGMSVFIYPTPLHYRLIPELAYDRNCTIMFATNTFLGHYARRAHPYDFRSVRMVISGAEKLTDEVRRAYMDKFGVRVIEGYGATECSPVVSANTFMASKTNTVGQLMPGMELRLEPVAGIEEGGLLHVTGPNVMLGYWRDSNPGVLEPPVSSAGPGWYNTGDIVTVDEEGFIAIKGRMKRFAKVAGEMISLETVEKIAETASPAALHGATAIPDVRRGEAIILFTQDRNLRRDQLQQAAQALGAPEIAVPRKVIHIEKIPLLGNGKKDYPALQKLALNGDRT